MNVYEARKRNLRNIIGDVGAHGAVAEFARQHDLDPTYIRQILNNHRKMGEKAARKFEETLKLPPGSLDQTLEYGIGEKAAEYNARGLSDEAIAIAVAFEGSTPELRAAALRMLGVLQEIDKKAHE